MSREFVNNLIKYNAISLQHRRTKFSGLKITLIGKLNLLNFSLSKNKLLVAPSPFFFLLKKKKKPSLRFAAVPLGCRQA